MANIVINSTAVRNNGDTALITTLAIALESRGHSVTFATSHDGHMRSIQGRHNVCPDVLGNRFPLFRFPLMRDLAAIIALLFNRRMRHADVLLGAPGGYINSYYGFRWKCTLYRWGRFFGKRTAIYSQSVGPLIRRDADFMPNLSNDLDLLVTRDDLSRRSAIEAGFKEERLLSSVDAIFLRPPSRSSQSESSNVVAISVREWRYDGRNFDHYMKLIMRLSQILVDRGFFVEFISTCQGVEGYIDDSTVAQLIVDGLNEDCRFRDKVTVVSHAFGIDDLVDRIASYRAIVGTRLHMCLLALLSGVPAFNISYERKGMECFEYLGMQKFSVDYNEDIELAARCLSLFLDEEGAVRNALPETLGRLHERACTDLDRFLARVIPQ